MEIKIKEKERIDDLDFKGLRIIQNEDGFCFGVDAVLLSDFAKNIKKNARVLDLGTGTGIISILLCGKTQLGKITGIEVQEEVCEMAQRSVILNQLEEKMDVISSNILDLTKRYEKNSIDVIVTNPPYKKKDTGIQNEKEKKVISRHETTASLEDFIRITKELLVDKGEFYMVHRPERLIDIITLMRQYKIEPKIMRFVYGNPNKEPKLVLIKGIKNARPFLKVEKNLYIYDEKGEYTQELKEIYHKND